MEVVGKVAEEVVVQGVGNAPQQNQVDVFLAENLMHVGTGAAYIICQLSGCHTLPFHYFLYVLTYMHKKAWNLFLAGSWVSTPTLTTSSSTPIEAFLKRFLVKDSLSRKCGKF